MKVYVKGGMRTKIRRQDPHLSCHISRSWLVGPFFSRNQLNYCVVPLPVNHSIGYQCQVFISILGHPINLNRRNQS